MIRAQWLILTGGMLLALTARAGAQASAEAVVDKAIEAQGGANGLERARVLFRESSGMIVINGMETPFTSELTGDLPDRYRLALKLGQERAAVLFVVNRDKAWHVTGGTTMEAGREMLNEMREEGFVLNASTLVPLRRDKAITLQLMPAGMHLGKPVNVVKASMKGRDDILLTFDKATNLLVKMSRKGTLAGLAVDKDYLFDDYKEFNGVKLPTRMQETLAGRKYMDSTIKSYRFLSKADDKDFAKP
jgi:hypothetical protein